jgi:hypothetical protein
MSALGLSITRDLILKVGKVRTYFVAVVISLLVSVAFECWLLSGGQIGSIWPCFVSPGLLAYAVTSDMLQKPAVYQTVALFVVLNVGWYLLLALFTRGAAWTIRRALALVSS